MQTTGLPFPSGYFLNRQISFKEYLNKKPKYYNKNQCWSHAMWNWKLGINEAGNVSTWNRHQHQDSSCFRLWCVQYWPQGLGQIWNLKLILKKAKFCRTVNTRCKPGSVRHGWAAWGPLNRKIIFQMVYFYSKVHGRGCREASTRAEWRAAEGQVDWGAYHLPNIW